MSHDEKRPRKFGSVSLPMGILEAIDALIEEFNGLVQKG